MIEVSAIGLRLVLGELRRYQNLFRQRLPAMFKVVAKVAQKQTERRVSTEKTDPDGSPWASWSDSYAESRQSFHSLLINSKELFRSFRIVLGREAALMGTEVPYASFVQKGTSTMPARPFLGVSSSNLQDMQARLDEWVSKQVEGG